MVRHDEIQVMQHSGRQLLALLIDQLERKASQPTVYRQFERAWRWLLDVLMPAIRRREIGPMSITYCWGAGPTLATTPTTQAASASNRTPRRRIRDRATGEPHGCDCRPTVVRPVDIAATVGGTDVFYHPYTRSQARTLPRAASNSRFEYWAKSPDYCRHPSQGLGEAVVLKVAEPRGAGPRRSSTSRQWTRPSGRSRDT